MIIRAIQYLFNKPEQYESDLFGCFALAFITMTLFFLPALFIQ